MPPKKLSKPKISNDQIKIIVASVLFVGAFGYIYVKYVWLPYSERIKTAETKIEQINKDITKATIAAKRYDRVLAELKALEKKAMLSEQKLPKTRKLPDLIFSIMKSSRKYDIEINYITPRPPVEKPYFYEVNYKMSIAGNYHIVGLFITSMVTSDRVFTIKNLSMSETKKNGNVEARFDLIAYKYKGEI